MSNANEPSTRGNAQRNTIWMRRLKRTAPENTAAPWDPYMLTDGISGHDEEILKLEAAHNASIIALAAKTSDDEEVLRREAAHNASNIVLAAKTIHDEEVLRREAPHNASNIALAAKTSHDEVLRREAARKAAKIESAAKTSHDEEVRQEAARKAVKTKLGAKTGHDEEVLRLEAARKAAKIAKTERARSVEGVAVSVSEKPWLVPVLPSAQTPEMPLADSCAQSLSSAPLPSQYSALVVNRGVRTKRKGSVKEPELPFDGPASQETLLVAGNLSHGICSNDLREANLQAKMESMDGHRISTMDPSVSKSEQDPQHRRVIKQDAGGNDWLNCDPPQCMDCGQCRWPTWTSKKGRVHCGVCYRPDGGQPPCSRCGKLTWDGLNGPGKRWFCEACFINDRAVEMQPSWTGWFRERRNRFPEAFVNGGPTFS